MATIKIRVPGYWPEFAVTSYYRPGDKGAHGKHRAIDITPIWSGSKDNDSAFWFVYFKTATLLWSAMRFGRVYIAQPPHCPHIHIDLDKTASMMGVEQTLPVNGKCQFNRLLLSVNKNNVFDNIKFGQRVRDLSDAYISAWTNIKEDYRYKFTKNSKYITVHGGNVISEQDLQAKLDSIFGDGSNMQVVYDVAAQIAGLQSADDFPSAGGFAVVALLGAALFFLAKDETPKR